MNTTPVGMYPNPGQSPVCLDAFPNLEGVLDLIYNPARTKLLMDAEDRGIIAENGLLMLVAQAKEAAEWFLGTQIEDSVIGRIHADLRASMENIILIGMPGCGKSTLGQILAQRLNMPFLDADAELVKDAGQTIPDIFSGRGEDHFRMLETQTLAKLCMGSGSVIATGGGCVTREENYRHLHQNGRILWITRDLKHLAADGRPLSQSYSAEQLWQTREPLYRRFADFVVDNNAAAEAAVSKILELLGRSK